MNFFLKKIRQIEGATSVEYAIMIMLVAAVIVGSVTLLGTSIIALFTKGEIASVIAGGS